MSGRIDFILEKSGILSRILAYIGAVALFGTMCLTAADVIGRYVFNAPILGVFELTEFLVLILIFSFLAYTQSQKTHVAVELLLKILPKKIQAVIDMFNHVVCLVLMILITWMGFKKALELMEVGEASPNLGIPDYPFVFFLTLGCTVMCLEYLRDIIRLFVNKKEQNSL
jgi:TRAP-type C4-dicarboxylate transport system permease small subunit